MVAPAALDGIRIEEPESEVEGDPDLQGFPGLDDAVPKGFTDIRMRYRVKAAPEDVGGHWLVSPVLNSMTINTSRRKTPSAPLRSDCSATG